MERLYASDIVLRRAMRRKEADQTDAFETLEHPAHGGLVCRLLDLAGYGLTCRGKSLAQAVLGKPVDQQAMRTHWLNAHYKGGSKLSRPLQVIFAGL